MHASVGVMAGPAAPQKGRWMCGGREKVDCLRHREEKSNRSSGVLVPPLSSTYHISRNSYEIQKIKSEFIKSESDVLDERRPTTRTMDDDGRRRCCADHPRRRY